jgi:predicted alpha-1,2-mannosidase
MKKKRLYAALGMACLVVPMIFNSLIPVGKSHAKVHPETDFFSSFESGDPPLDWVNTVETTPDGHKKASGIDGEIRYDAIQGDITDEVEKVTASGENPPNEIAANLIDKNTQTKWLTFQNAAWIEMRLNKPEAVNKYEFTSANDYPGRDPKDWTLYGSNDGTNWEALDTRNDESFDRRFQRHIYEFENDKKYTFYKFEITKNAGDPLTQLAEIEISNGIDVPPPPPSDMKSMIGNGPGSSYTAKTNVGWTGKHALTYAGTHLTKGRAYSYNKIYNVNIEVTPETQLSYYIHPEFVDNDQLDYSSTYVSIDLAFSDGTYLSDLGALDQHGVKLNPQAQGESKTLYVNQWNYRISNIGEVAAGKTIKRILVAYDHPNGPGKFKGSIDEIKIEGHPKASAPTSRVDYVNTLRGTNSNGTFSRGNTFPAVAVPHGFNFWTPVTNAGSNWLYSYQQSNNENNLPEIQAFSVSHEPSPWMGDRQTFQVMPSDSDEDKPSVNRNERALAFKHENETAKPYYYSVKFENGIQTEMAPTNHAAIFKFTFKGNTSNLIFDNVNNNGGLTIHSDMRTVTGYSDVKSGLSAGATRMYVYATFDKTAMDGGKLTGENRDNVTGYLRFDTSGNDKTVTMKIATSLISVDQAKKNLEQEIGPYDTLESIKTKAKKMWNDKLKIIDVEGASYDQLVTLYSNMYRLFLYPNVAYENTGTVKSPVYKYASPFSDPLGESTETETGAKIMEGKPYVNNGFWDTYRTVWPAYTLLTPKEAGQMIDGFVQQYKDGGWISRWSSPGYANLMVGTSSDVAFADAYLKGVTNFDVESFYESAIKNASVYSSNQSVGRKGLDTSIFDGYTNNQTGEGLSWALEGYINDFGIAYLAKALAEKTDKKHPKHTQYEADYKYFMNRAQNYVKLFNPETGFFMGKTPSEEWDKTPETFDPRSWGGDYTETNAWNMAFHVPQDGQGLANLYGGRKALAKKLDEFFSTPETALYPGAYGGAIHEMREARDVRMGMFGFSNQPSHHIVYMYDFAGEPWKTQEKVREVLSRLYIGSEIGQGYPGDEDNGEMSAWYIFSSAGFYPLQMGKPEYVIGAPFFKKMTIHLENGKAIVINAPNVSDKNKYIQSVKLNGKPYNKVTLSQKDLVRGARLDFVMGPRPSKWGTGEESLPKSMTSSSMDGSSLVPAPMNDLTDHLLDQGKAEVSNSDGIDAEKLFDNTSKTNLTLTGRMSWVQFKFKDGAREVRMYTLTSGSDGAQDPKSWLLEGSNDGKNWRTLDKETNQNFQWRLYTRPFVIKQPGKYLYYRLQVTDTSGTAGISLAELELLGRNDLREKFSKVEQEIEQFVQSGDIKAPAQKLLMHDIKRASKFTEDAHPKQAVDALKTLLRHVEKSKEHDISEKAKRQLIADTNALIELVS